MVHAVWGPYGEDNINNTKFVLTLVEDHNMVIWTYLLQSKEEVCEVLKSYIMMIQNQFNTHIKAFRIDNGTELVNRRVEVLFKEEGILHQKTCV